MSTRHSIASAVLFVAAIGAVGCGNVGDRPNLGLVRGVVTLEGQPVEGVLVTFQQDGVRASQGLTDAQGVYELVYLRDIRGAALGSHSVSFQDYQQKKRVPKKYVGTAAFTEEVTSGSNEINFDLTSD